MFTPPTRTRTVSHPESSPPTGRPRAILGWLSLGLALVGSGCLHAPLNPPKESVQPGPGYYFRTHVPASLDGGETLFLVAFSGGGTRAAAMAYGVLEELRRTPVPSSQPPRKLVEDINVISSVSGGSFPAAAYALFGDEMFDSFVTNFLKRNVQGKLVGKTLSPWNWPRIGSPWYGRSDMAAKYYDEILFKGATFGDIKPGRRPFVLLNTTEVSTGLQFWFTQDVFDNICSDLSNYPVSRAVAASSAVPVLLSPITLKNYGGECGYVPPEWQSAKAQAGDGMALLRRGEELAELRNRTNRPYLHLVDGGVADNLGLRPLLEGLAYLESVPSSRQGVDLSALRRVVLLSVNAHSSPENDWDEKESPPGMLALAVASSGITMERYSRDTIALMANLVANLERKTKDLRGAGASELRFFPIEISFDNLSDPAERRYFLNVPTSFFLSDQAVDRLRDVGGKLLRDSPQFQALLQDLAARPGTAR
ncbi:MAG: patatin-like phospholipase family protein [Verrucomicrobia bacterium]|nr:patatin-like phospholipase family protein [Verrucomicrobiota bacterium]